ncbi:unnamed protein product [Caenorhabditis nigoni]
MDVTESIVLVLHIVFVAFLTWSSYKNKNKEIPITVAYLDNNDFMNLFNSYQNVHLYHYAPEIVVPVTVMVLSIEWKKKVVPVVTIN